jgi:hypothetical protein
MNTQSLVAGLALAGILTSAVPATPVLGNGAASTRNILILTGAGAAAYLIIQHNKKVHEQRAAEAAERADLEQHGSDAWAAYRQEQRAYSEEVAANRELQKEIAYQHGLVQAQQHQLAALGDNGWGQL